MAIILGYPVKNYPYVLQSSQKPIFNLKKEETKSRSHFFGETAKYGLSTINLNDQDELMLTHLFFVILKFKKSVIGMRVQRLCRILKLSKDLLLGKRLPTLPLLSILEAVVNWNSFKEQKMSEKNAVIYIS